MSQNGCLKESYKYRGIKKLIIFELDTIQTDENNMEVGLYAKWVKN